LFDALKKSTSHDFHGESRKFYNRYLAYEMTMQGQRKYSAYVYMREDNYFVKPLDLDQVFFNSARAVSRAAPFVAVDAPCSMGRYSDKFYVTNKLGADLLFAGNFDEHVERMKHYVLRWHYFSTQSRMPYQPGQPEAFTADLLSTAQVQRVNMHRMDVRYVGNKLCSPGLYYIACQKKRKSWRMRKVYTAAQNSLVEPKQLLPWATASRADKAQRPKIFAVGPI